MIPYVAEVLAWAAGYAVCSLVVMRALSWSMRRANGTGRPTGRPQ